MQVTGVTVGEREEKVIGAIYRYLKEAFPGAEYDDRGEILGIGEPERHLLCYFSMDAAGLRIKFKGRPAIRLADNADWVPLADAAIRLFRENDFTRRQERAPAAPMQRKEKKPASEEKYREKRTPSAESAPKVTIENYLFGLREEMSEISEEAKGRTFESCSVRLRNALHALGADTVGELLAYTPEQIFGARNLGRYCLAELYNLLRALNGKEPALPPAPVRPAAGDPPAIDYASAYRDYRANRERYEELYAALFDFILRFTEARLDERMKKVVYARLGIGERAKTLQEIGDSFGVTRERIRQILEKAYKRLAGERLPPELLKELRELREEAAQCPPGGLLAYFYVEGGGPFIAEFVCKRFFRQELQRNELAEVVRKGLSEDKRAAEALQRREKFNAEIGRLIVYPSEPKPFEEGFGQLRTEREVHPHNTEAAVLSYGGKEYACESFFERDILERFLVNGTFREIKTQSIKVPFRTWNYHPDFQCLTHDGKMVIVEVMPLIKMLNYENIQKFRALREYCAKNGFGYLITDDRNNSFDAVNVHAPAFEARIMEALERNKSLRYDEFIEIYRETRANLLHFLTLIKTQDLELHSPFRLIKHREET